MQHDPTRIEEALLAGAGYCVSRNQNCDFRLDHVDHDEWEIAVLSGRAHAWIRSELSAPLAQCLGDSFKVDILGADRFLKRARALGFQTEFVGGGGKDRF
ncbi:MULTISPECIES: hypothetical protein [unclassified Rhizobium]|jgi:hypothetical protein|uniref:hypothetical protein n=1 Tax=unclassified Rhizobium TaxID=2613769 RepID=UPI0009E07349|nr:MULTISPECIES: hypothetical protein [unclassified Rhizobium]RKD35543.1 hypothetical protein BJ928_1416 [Rhizobium sp. WW_1]